MAALGGNGRILTQTPSAHIFPFCAFIPTLKRKPGRGFSHLKKPELSPQEMYTWDTPAIGKKKKLIKNKSDKT